MKYLGLIIDSQWTLGPHFDSLVLRVSTAANALCSLLPNIGGTGVAVRQLYEDVVRSRVMYEVPVWVDDPMATRRSILLLKRLHRVTAIRIVRGYRTVSRASAILAESLWKLRTLVLERKYSHMRALNPVEDTAEQAVLDDLGTAEEDTWDQWRFQLINEGAEHPDVEAVLPSWEAWRSLRGLPLTYRMTQILTGHGVFGKLKILLKIGREMTDICCYCEEGRDTT